MASGESRAVYDVKQLVRDVLLLTVYCLLLTVFLASCGRRGDPVMMEPYEETVLPEQSSASEDAETEPARSGTAENDFSGTRPQAPKGLTGIFTGEKVVLVWEEVTGQGVSFYRVYRSSGDGFSLTGEAANPIFNDREIEYGARYFYKVSAVGQSESSMSDSVEVVAGGD